MRRRSALPVSHFVHMIPETPAQLRARGVCPTCETPTRLEPGDDNTGDRRVSVCARCHWDDYDEQTAEHLRGLADDPGFTSGFEG
jgi:hypothetical protein